MNLRRLSLGKFTFIGVLAATTCWTLGTYIVEEQETILISQFGRIVRTVNEPGLYLRAPAPIHNVLRFSKKLNVFESIPTEILSKDKKNLLINNYLVWKISDPLTFYKTIGDQKSALIRLEDLAYSTLRNEVGLYTFSEIITSKRDDLAKNVTLKTRIAAETFGIKVIDIQIKRVAFPTQNLAAVYRRMNAERTRIATRYRSEGQEQAMKIRAEAEREREEILALSRKEALAIRGEGEARAMEIYGVMIRKDAGYYEFKRSMDLYRNILKENATVVLSTESPLMKYLNTVGSRRNTKEDSRVLEQHIDIQRSPFSQKHSKIPRSKSSIDRVVQ